ncbi:MAG: Pyrimidine-nucleoside phosphorylase [Methanobacteriota archaeon]|nr:MAG: Pyrimidine-nucleoside phosphorylase [Euryarchaeota archaeon]
MRIADLIALKRDNNELNDDQIKFLIDSITNDNIQPEQIGALLMSIFLNGMTTKETTTLTKSMRDSGIVFEWENKQIIADKHSTGGVGDKISIPLAPALAACGLKIPMIAGRGLEHTGGTIDKLESINGYNSALNPNEIKKIVNEIGCVITTQTNEMIPADRILYAMRDLTSTVASIPLITGSIISKKAAEGLSSLVLDIKVGSAAFMKDIDSAIKLAKSMVNTGKQMGINTVALLTEMDNPLGFMSGNALEIIESVSILKGKGPKDCIELILSQGAELLYLSGLEKSKEDGMTKIKNVLENGDALKKFKNMIIAQGVEKTYADQICDNPEILIEKCKFKSQLFTKKSGFVASINAMSIAEFILHNGGGRTKMEQEINHNIGVELHIKVGDYHDVNNPWATIYHDTKLDTSNQLINCVNLTENKVENKSRILKIIS